MKYSPCIKFADSRYRLHKLSEGNTDISDQQLSRFLSGAGSSIFAGLY